MVWRAEIDDRELLDRSAAVSDDRLWSAFHDVAAGSATTTRRDVRYPSFRFSSNASALVLRLLASSWASLVHQHIVRIGWHLRRLDPDFMLGPIGGAGGLWFGCVVRIGRGGCRSMFMPLPGAARVMGGGEK